MNITAVFSGGMFLIVAGFTGHTLYKQHQKSECLGEASQTHQYSKRKLILSECLRLGASKDEIETANDLGQSMTWSNIARNVTNAAKQAADAVTDGHYYQDHKGSGSSEAPNSDECANQSNVSGKGLLDALIPVCDENGNPSGKNYRGQTLEYK